MQHLFSDLFPPDFWMREAIALKNTLLELLRVIAIYVVGRWLINSAAVRIAAATVSGPHRLGLIHHAAAEARVRTMISLVQSVGRYALFFVCTILLLRALNFDAVSVVTSASVAGIAVGLGAQKLFKDVISGFFIILENQYVIGDYVTINSTITGRVEEMGMRIVRVRDDSGRLTIIANGDISQVCNQSRGTVSTVVEMGVPPGTDLAKARELVDAAGQAVFEAQSEQIGYTKAPVLQGIGGGDSTRTVLRVAIEVSDPSQLVRAGVAVRDAAFEKLLAAGITPL